MSPWSRCGLAVASGILDVLGFAGFGIYPLTWIAKVPVLFAIRDVEPRQALLLGLLYGAVGHFGGYYWMVGTMKDFAGFSFLTSTVLAVLGAAVLGAMIGLLMVFVRIAKRDLGLAPVWVLMVAYPALELVYPNIFPYRIGASQYRFSEVTQIVELTGLLGLTGLIGMVNGGFYELTEAWRERRRPVASRWTLPAAVMILVFAVGAIRIRQVDAGIAKARTISVGLVQTNQPAQDKVSFNSEIIRRHREMTRDMIAAHPEVELVVWPETVLFSESRDLGRLGELIQPERPMVAGVMVRDAEGRKFNSMFAFARGGVQLDRFDKVRLVPFSESMPLAETFPRLRSYFPEGVFTERGTTYGNLRVAETTLMPMVCYEDILPDFAREMWRRAGPPGALINVTNDSWFGNTQQPVIHLALASFRAIETRRSLIRSTATGISALVDPAGRIVAQSEQWRPETLVGRIPLFENGATSPYLRFGDWFGWVCVVLTVVGLVACRRSRGRKPLTCKGGRDRDHGEKELVWR